MRIMKKYFYNLLTAATVVVLGVSVASCSNMDNVVVPEEDVPAPAVIINDELASRGIRTDMESAVIEVPVSCQGEWSAAIPKDDDWLQILDWELSYNGNQTLELLIDENATKKTRESKLMLADKDGNVTEIKITQTNSVINGTFTTSASAFSGKGLGCGIDYDYVLNLKNNIAREERGEPFLATKIHLLNNVFNMAKIEKLQKQSEKTLAPSAYVEAVIPIADVQALLYDSCLVQDKTLDVGLELEISYGPVSGRAKGEYSSVAKESRDYIDYAIIRKAPMYDVYLSPAELSTYADSYGEYDGEAVARAEKNIKDKIDFYVKQNEKRGITDVNSRGLTEKQEAIVSAMEDNMVLPFDYAGILSASFTKRYNELYLALVEATAFGDPDYAKADLVLDALDNEYGPFIIAGAEFGGSMTILTEVSRDLLDGESTLSGEIQAEVSGMFSMSGAIRYSEKGFSLLRKINPNIYIYGGNANDTASGYWSIMLGETPSNLDSWTQVMEGWIGSMWSGTDDEPQESQAAPISYKITPIWMLFTDSDIQKYAQDYFLKKYEDRGIYGYFNIMKGKTEGGQAEEASNQDSDFWQNKSEE